MLTYIIGNNQSRDDGAPDTGTDRQGGVAEDDQPQQVEHARPEEVGGEHRAAYNTVDREQTWDN